MIIAHRFGLPEPGVLASYVGWATLSFIAGASITAMSMVAGIVSAIQRAVRGSQAKTRHAKEQWEEIEANMSSLTPGEFLLLADLLERNSVRLKVHILSQAYKLVEKGVLYQVDYSGVEPMCEVPKLLRDQKAPIIAAAREARQRLRDLNVTS
ncbi:hypothetical protein IF803_23195 [Bradyrhizobium sp. UFLA06-06]